MVRLNSVTFDYRPGMTLKQLMDEYNAANPAVAFDGFIFIVNGAAITAAKAQEYLIQDNDTIFIGPILSGG